MPVLNLRAKLLLFSTILALIPVGIAGQSLVTIMQDELKSSINDELVTTADNLAREIDVLFSDTWIAPLILMRDAIDNPAFGAKEKLAILTSANSVADFVGLQLSLEGIDQPILIAQDSFSKKLKELKIDPVAAIRVPSDKMKSYFAKKDPGGGDISYIKEADTWLLTLLVPLHNTIAGRRAILFGRVNLDRIKTRVREHGFNKTGTISVVDSSAHRLFDASNEDLSSYSLVHDALKFLESGARPIGVLPYTRPDSSEMLGGYAFPLHFDWAILVERDKDGAYAPVYKMRNTLEIWVALGLAAAVIGAMIFAQRISRPVVEIGGVAAQVGTGNFDVRVRDLRSKDEIAQLGAQINSMIDGLRERERIKDIFGRYQTVEVMKTLLEKPGGLTLGGERRRVTIMMTDLRGYTALSERLEPEKIITMLNNYFEVMVDICNKYNGTVNEIIGDALLVIFGAPIAVEDHAQRAVACALEMQCAMDKVNEINAKIGLPALEMGIGVNTGDVVVGNIGSKKRTKYGIVGSDVNLTSRIESFTVGSQVLISESVLLETGKVLKTDSGKSVEPKGVKKPIKIYAVHAITGEYNVEFIGAEEDLNDLKKAIVASCVPIDGKDTGGAGIAATILKLSKNEAEMQINTELAPLTNLKIALRLADEKLAAMDVYGKVLEKVKGSDSRYRVRFTSLTPEMKAHLDTLT